MELIVRFEGLFGTRIFKKRLAELEKQEREALAAVEDQAHGPHDDVDHHPHHDQVNRTY